MALGDFDKVIKVNLIGSFNMLRLATAGMSKLEPLVDRRARRGDLHRFGRGL